MSAQEFYRASTIKRVRRTAAQVLQLDRQIIDVLRQDHPQSPRHVFCRITDPRLPEPVEKSDRGYRHVQERCTATASGVRLHSGVGDFVARMAGLYRSDLWADADYRCEVWAESRSIASVLLEDCQDLAVSLYPCGGFSSLSFVHEAAELHNNLDDWRPLQIFYIGDYDPAGVLIDRSLEQEMRRHLSDDIELNFERIGINPEQIEEFKLPTKPRKESDARSQHITFTVEAEAMPAGIMRRILREKVEALLPENALAVAKVAEQSERAHLRKMAQFLYDSPRGGSA